MTERGPLVAGVDASVIERGSPAHRGLLVEVLAPTSLPVVSARATRARVSTWNLLVTAVVFAAALWPAIGNAWLFPKLAYGTDDGFYLMQAEVLETGHLTMEAPASHEDA